MAKALRYVLALARTVAGGAAIEGDAIVVSAGPRVRGQPGCPACGRRCECHDHEPTRRRGAMDLARPECFPGYGPAGAACPEHGVRAGRVPWARHGPGHARDLGDRVACLAAGCRVPAHPRVARAGWHGVGGICGRACDETGAQGGASRLDGPRRAGIDEASHEKGHKHPAVVVDHGRGCLARAHEGHGKEAPGPFPDEPASGDAPWRPRRPTGPSGQRRRPGAGAPTPGGSRAHSARPGGRATRPAGPGARGGGPPRGPPRTRCRGATGPAGRAGARRPRRGPGRRGRLRTRPGEAATRWRGTRRTSRGRGGRGPPSPGGRLLAAWDPEGDLRAVFRAGTAVGAEAMPDGWPRGAACREIGPVVAVERRRGAGARTSLPPWRRAPESAARGASTTRLR